MKVTALKTDLVAANADLESVLQSALPQLQEKSVVVVASKLVSTCEDRFVPKVTGSKEEKYDLVRQEADYFTDPQDSKYEIMLTIKDNWMFVNAGIDESNADGSYLLWPKDPQQSAQKIWSFLRQHYGVKKLGVVLTDSRSIPLNWGVQGHGIAYCGFQPLKSYIGQPDLYGREMKMEQLNMMQSLASAAVLEMGEGAERTPIAVVEDVTHLEFQDRVPSSKELADLKISLEEDIFAPLLTSAKWQS